MHKGDPEKAKKVTEKDRPEETKAQEGLVVPVVLLLARELEDAGAKASDDGVIDPSENVPAGFGASGSGRRLEGRHSGRRLERSRGGSENAQRNDNGRAHDQGVQLGGRQCI